MGWFAEEPGGLNRMYAGLLGSFEADGVVVRGLVAGNAQSAVAAPSGLEFFAGRRSSALQRMRGCRRAVARALRADAVDVVAAHFALYAWPVLDLLGERRFVFHFHGPWASESRAESENPCSVAMKRSIEARVYRRADRFIVLSSAFGRILGEEYRVSPEQICVIPGGVDAKRYNAGGSRLEARQALRLPTDRPLIVAVRRLIHRVGLEGLIDAMGEVRRAVPEALLLIAGRGVMADELSARIHAAGLEQHVRLLGFVPESELPLLYRACDLSIVPSVALEGFGLPTIESLAAGTPVLVTPVGGLPETVTALDPELVLPDASSAAIAAGLRGALREPQRLPSPDRCADYVREHFDWPVVAKRVLAVYQQ
jgi:glycogen synthase